MLVFSISTLMPLWKVRKEADIDRAPSSSESTTSTSEKEDPDAKQKENTKFSTIWKDRELFLMFQAFLSKEFSVENLMVSI